MDRPPDAAKARLSRLLDTWATMDETAWTQEAVDRLKNEILDTFSEHPRDADTWFREWRQAHPEAKLA
jgi:hypothetical protein